jgi:hypothetical protein
MGIRIASQEAASEVRLSTADTSAERKIWGDEYRGVRREANGSIIN